MDTKSDTRELQRYKTRCIKSVLELTGVNFNIVSQELDKISLF